MVYGVWTSASASPSGPVRPRKPLLDGSWRMSGDEMSRQGTRPVGRSMSRTWRTGHGLLYNSMLIYRTPWTGWSPCTTVRRDGLTAVKQTTTTTETDSSYWLMVDDAPYTHLQESWQETLPSAWVSVCVWSEFTRSRRHTHTLSRLYPSTVNLTVFDFLNSDRSRYRIYSSVIVSSNFSEACCRGSSSRWQRPYAHAIACAVAGYFYRV